MEIDCCYNKLITKLKILNQPISIPGLKTKTSEWNMNECEWMNIELGQNEMKWMNSDWRRKNEWNVIRIERDLTANEIEAGLITAIDWPKQERM